MPVASKQLILSEEMESLSIKPALSSSFQYKKSITSPRTALEWHLALANPLSEIGRDYFTLVVNECAEKSAIIKFQKKLAVTTYVQQERVKAHTLRELEYQATHQREKLLQAWAAAQLKYVPQEDFSKGVMQQVIDLLSEIGRLALRFSGITMQQTMVDKQWNNLYQIKAQHIFEQLRINHVALPCDLTKSKQHQLTQALTPLSPALLLKLHPGLAKKVRHLEEQDKSGLHSVCLNLCKTNDVMGELAFHSLLTHEDEPLMGLALLAAIKQYKRPFQQAGISFMTVDPLQQAAILEQYVALFNQKENTRIQMENIENQIKGKIRELKEANPHAGIRLKAPHSR